MPPAAMLAAGTDNGAFSGVWSVAARVAGEKCANVNSHSARGSRRFISQEPSWPKLGLWSNARLFFEAWRFPLNSG
jgi:hypothetical protein